GRGRVCDDPGAQGRQRALGRRRRLGHGAATAGGARPRAVGIAGHPAGRQALQHARSRRALTLGDLYLGFFAAGARGFGGALPWTRRMLVEERRWLTAREFNDVFGLCNLLPGPNTLNITIVVGSRFHGWRGALAGVAGLLSLPLAVTLLLAALFAHIGTLPSIESVLRGVGAAVAGL